MLGLFKIVSIAACIQNLAQAVEETEEGANNWPIKPFQANRRNNGTREIPPANDCFARWPEPTLLVENNEVLFAGDIPGHNALSQLKIKLRDDYLMIESTISMCRHAHTLAIPAGFCRIKEKQFKNGLLIIKIGQHP